MQVVSSHTPSAICRLIASYIVYVSLPLINTVQRYNFFLRYASKFAKKIKKSYRYPLNTNKEHHRRYTQDATLRMGYTRIGRVPGGAASLAASFYVTPI